MAPVYGTADERSDRVFEQLIAVSNQRSAISRLTPATEKQMPPRDVEAAFYLFGYRQLKADG
jgi:hypothetical protein